VFIMKRSPYDFNFCLLCIKISLVKLLLGTCVERRELLPTPLRGTHDMSRLQETRAEVPNLSKGEMRSNYSFEYLSI
jgi:hypothetical protein